MIRLNIITPGKTRESWISEGIKHYSKLVSKYAELNFIIVRAEKVLDIAVA